MSTVVPALIWRLSRDGANNLTKPLRDMCDKLLAHDRRAWRPTTDRSGPEERGNVNIFFPHPGGRCPVQ
jgi:hypothetical protein